MRDTFTIRIRRESGYVDHRRSYKVKINGEIMGKIGDGGFLSIPLSTGRCSLHLTIDWCRSNEVVFLGESGQTLDFECGCSVGGSSARFGLFTVIFQRSGYLWVREITSSKRDLYDEVNSDERVPETVRCALRLLGLMEPVTFTDVKLAYREQIKQFHPDLVAHLEPNLQRVAVERTKKLNLAYEVLEEFYENK